jgi:lipopolysaccharide export system protein LptA
MKIFGLILIGALGLLMLAQAAQPRILGKGNIKNFQTKTEDAERTTFLQGTNAVQLPNGLLEITEPRVQTFRGKTNTPEFLIESPLCYFDNATKAAFSSHALKARSVDGRFSISGVGFSWEPKSGRLSISNDVQSEFKRALLRVDATNKVSRGDTNRTIKIRSVTLDYTPEQALFTRDVEVLEPDGKMTSSVLKLDLSQGGQLSKIEAGGGVAIEYQKTKASGEGATYDVAEDLFTLTNNTTWSLGDRSGTSGFLLLRRARNELSARDHVRLSFPVTGLGLTNSAARAANDARLMVINSSSFDYTTNRAHFEGAVTALEGDAQLNSSKLDVNFSTNQTQISTASAFGDVRFSKGDRRASGERASYDLLRQKITLEGGERQTEWSIGDRRGSSDLLELRTVGDEFTATGRVKMDLPVRPGMIPALSLPNRAPLTNTVQKLHIEAGRFTRKGDQSIFEQKVTARTDQGTIAAESAILTTGVSNQVTRVLARDHVVVHQKDRVATGDLAEYDAQTGLLQLSGDPSISDPSATIRGERFILDMNSGGFRTQGKYRIELRRAEKGP